MDASLIRAFAIAVATPGGQAMVLGSDNKAAGWCSVETAVTSGASFAVAVRKGVLAIDADSLELGVAAEGLAAELTQIGILPVVLASGRPGHRHVFARLGPRLLDHFASMARARGLDVRQ